jgi:hypothetical protein
MVIALVSLPPAHTRTLHTRRGEGKESFWVDRSGGGHGGGGGEDNHGGNTPIQHDAQLVAHVERTGGLDGWCSCGGGGIKEAVECECSFLIAFSFFVSVSLFAD